MDSIADLGGTSGWGRVHPPDAGEPVFAEPWQGRALALTILSIQLSGRNVDAFRHAMERLDRGEYFDEGYYGRWLNGAESMLVDGGILAPGEIDARARELAARHAGGWAEPARPTPPGTAVAAWRGGPDSLRTIDPAPAFTVGQRIRARDVSPPGHTRLPRYVRGHTGVVEIVQPAAVFPDTRAHLQSENPQHVYSVRFDSRDLWGPDADAFAVTVEMFESYLEAVP